MNSISEQLPSDSGTLFSLIGWLIIVCALYATYRVVRSIERVLVEIMKKLGIRLETKPRGFSQWFLGTKVTPTPIPTAPLEAQSEAGYCSKCGQGLKPNDAYCPRCGKQKSQIP